MALAHVNLHIAYCLSFFRICSWTWPQILYTRVYISQYCVKSRAADY